MTLMFYTWSEFEKNCGYSRLYGGVNFPDSVANVKDMAVQMGRRAIDFVRYHVNLASASSSKNKYGMGQNQQGYHLYSRERTKRKNEIGADNKNLNYKYFLMNPT